MNERELIKKCQNGDRQAFEDLIRLYYDYVSGFLLKATGDKLLSEDLTQDTFLKMICGIENYKPKNNVCFGTWLITIAKNRYIDYLRRNSVYIEDIDTVFIADVQNIGDTVDNKLQYEQLLKAIESLPPEQGIAIRLKYEEDLTLNEIAKKFRTPAKTIKSRIHEGTVKLRKLIKSTERSDCI